MAIERITPGTKEWTLFYGNHISRYIFAKKILEENNCKKILDIACGVGYGANYLSEISGSEIIGVDRSVEALRTADTHFKAGNIQFIKDDCIVPLNLDEHNHFDGIASFETLEHLKEEETNLFLKNLYDKLKTGGTLIISTPNALVSSTSGVVNWDFHEKEYTPDEFYQMLVTAGFKDLQLFGQKFSEIGRLRDDIKKTMNAVTSNPFFRLGRFLQKIKGIKLNDSILHEKENDFSIMKYQKKEIAEQKSSGPFVLIIVCNK